MTFTTHGHRVDSELASELRGNVHFVRISMDGLGAAYERLRGRPFHAFRRQVALIGTIAPFGLNVVVNDDTVCQLDDIATFAYETGAKELLLLPERPVGVRPGIGSLAADQLGTWVKTTAQAVRLTISKNGATADMPLADPFVDEEPLDGHAHVDARGLLKTDAFAAEGVPVGDSIIDALARLRARRTW